MVIKLNKYNIISSGVIEIPDNDTVVSFEEGGLSINVKFEEEFSNESEDKDNTKVYTPFHRHTLSESDDKSLDVVFYNFKSSTVINYSTGLIKIGKIQGKDLFYIMTFSIIGSDKSRKIISMRYTWLTSKSNNNE